MVDNKDKRIFRRYPGLTDVDLTYNNKLFRAKTFDYSLTGIGAKIEGIPRFGKGDLLSFRVARPEIRSDGEIMWLQSDGSGFKLGIRNVGRQIRGLLKEFSFADTLIGLQRSLKTGVLSIESGDIVKKVYIKKGDMIFSASNQPEDRLGDVLLKEGVITSGQYDDSVVELKKTGQRQGAILVRLGYLRPEELVIAVRHQAEQIILDIFGLEDGIFAFEERPLPTSEIITLSLSVANLIYYGIKKIKNIPFISGGLPSGDGIPCFSSNPIDLFQDIKLDYLGRQVVSCIDNKTPVSEIISITRLDGIEVLKALYALMSVRMIEIKSPLAPVEEMPREVLEEIVEGHKDQQVDPAIKELIEDMHRRYEAIGYYGILGVKDHAPAAEIKAAYYKAAKKYHPDRHFSLADDALKSKLGDIFSYVYEAYSTLTDPVKRKEYDTMITLRPAKVTATHDKARAAFEEGKVQFKKNNYTEAELFFGQAAYFDMTIAEYHYHYGMTLMKKQKFKAAEKAMERALRLEPANAAYLAEQGFVFLELGLPVRARGLFEKALKISPDNARASEGLMKIQSE